MQVVKQPLKALPIVQDLSVYADYPRVALSADVGQLFDSVSAAFPRDVRVKVERLQTLLECYLQITSQNLNVEKLYGDSFKAIASGFVGALESESFFLASRHTRYNYRSAFRRLIVECALLGPISYIPALPTTIDFLSLAEGICIKQFNKMRLCVNRVWIWRAWKIQDLNGGVAWLRLEPLTRRFDQKFTQAFYEICDIYYANGRSVITTHISRIVEFTANYPGVTPANLLNEDYATSFWHSFYNYYLREELKTCKVSTIVTTWYRLVKTFAESHLFPSRLFGKPSVFPTPPRQPVIGDRLNLGVGQNGKLQIEKLLTHVPVQLSHRDAIDILFRRLQRDVDLLLAWANAEAAIIWDSYNKRIAWEKDGIVREPLPIGSNKKIYLTDRENPDHLKNAAATIAKHYGGYGTRESHPTMSLVLPAGLSKLARELGFPLSNSLLPHMAILVHEHPEITPSFLEKLELFDSRGKLKGFVTEDFGYSLIGVKMRRGSQLAEQQIALSPRAAEIVLQVKAITEAPRKYLKDRDNKDWRYLFLSTGQGFKTPTRIVKIYQNSTDPKKLHAFAAQISSHTNIEPAEAVDLASRFSLPALRASMGVLEYIGTSSGPKMSAKLGHSEYNEKLLARYLPSAIRAFLQTRYIRIMQTGIIVEAMKDSPYLLEAAAFSTNEELNAFLSNHAIRFPSNRPPEAFIHLDESINSRDDAPFERVIFEINIDVLVVYVSLAKAFLENPQLTNSTARYWNQIGTRLMTFIEEKKDAEPTHMEMLTKARSRANYEYVRGIFDA